MTNARTKNVPPHQLMAVSEAASRLAISRASVYRLIADGRLRTVLIGGCRRVTEQALAELVAECEQ